MEYPYCQHICKSAKRRLGLLYGNFRQADQRTLSQLYKALVLPKLDYCSCVWDPATSTLINRMESVQKFAAKLCMKRWSDSSDSLVSGLNWATLRYRWSRLKAQLCRRIILNEPIISPSSYFSPPPHFNPRSHHHRSVCVPFARTASFQSSFFYFCLSSVEQPSWACHQPTNLSLFQGSTASLPCFT